MHSLSESSISPVELIMALDLAPIKVKLMEPDEGLGWSRNQCDLVEVWYKRYLVLSLLYPEESIVPNREIDEFWHQHILDTRKYADDCQATFGYFLHHFPYFGMRGEEDAKNLASSFAKTLDLFQAEFGESLDTLRRAFPESQLHAAAKCDGSNCSSKDCSKCGKSCTSGKCNPKMGELVRPSLVD